MHRIARTARRSFAALLVNFDENPTEQAAEDESTFEIPEDLSNLDDAALAALHTEAIGHFDSIYGDGSDLSSDDLTALAGLTEGIEALSAEQTKREAAASERAAQAAALASRVRPAAEGEPAEGPVDGESVGDPAPVTDEPNTGPGAGDGAQAAADGATQPAVEGVGTAEANPQLAHQSSSSIVASSSQPAGRAPLRVSLPARSAHTPRRSEQAERTNAPRRMEDVLTAAAGLPGTQPGQGLDWAALGRGIDRRLASFNAGQYGAAAASGRHMHETHGVAVIEKPYGEGLTIASSDPEHVEEVLRRAVDESRLPGGSLTAAGGWCAPSETIYSLFEIESRDGIFSLPEIGIARGGIKWTLGPDFSTLYNGSTSWNYTEAQDIAGTYAVDANGIGTGAAGTKPCYRVPCPTFDEKRLDLTGICIQAGLLQSRGYPEMIARTVRGVLVAHDHKLAGRTLAAIESGSTAVTMPNDPLGATSPLLDAIELQVEHYRYTTRISRSTTLEAVFPFWVLGVVRSDLGKRLGVNMLDVSDAQIIGWFRNRGIAPQFTYNWQNISGTAASFTKWPASVKFLLYPAGAWVRGGSDVITVDTLYDSVLLGKNDFTALFTEEGWLVAKMAIDSRVVTVTLNPNGATSAGVAAVADGTTA